MKTLGIVGGIAPESTVDYYRSIIRVYREQAKDGAYPSLIINSIDVGKLLALAANDLAALTDYLLDALQKLARAGADFALLASNTPHIVFDDVAQQSPLPLISIVETARDTARRMGLKKLGLFGTRFTMQGRFYPDAFARSGIALQAPPPDDLAYIHQAYTEELVNGIYLPATRDRLLNISTAWKQRDGIEGIVLAGTELPLLLRDLSVPGLVFLDTTQIHVHAAVQRMLA
jgi:aspartate racemase